MVRLLVGRAIQGITVHRLIVAVDTSGAGDDQLATALSAGAAINDCARFAHTGWTRQASFALSLRGIRPYQNAINHPKSI